VLSTWGLGQGPSHTERIGVSFNSDAGRGPVAPAQWHNPVAAPLPHASGMSIYCLYGTGVPTERRYFYKKNPTQEGVPYIIDTSINLPEENVRVGVKFGDGDASVPLVSLGYMCRSGWKDPHLNPGGAGTVTREYADGGKMGADLSDPFRQGPKAADHVDIMGNVDLIEDVVRIATGWGGKLEDRVASGIDEECRAIDERNGRRGGGKVEML
jgi:phospholipid:diacylglycerol acyltransferase